MRRALIVLLSITAALAVDKKPLFAPQPADSYPGPQTADKITVAAKPYNTDELAASAFGKVKPHQRGVLPVLVVIKNDTGKALRLDLKAEFEAPDGKHYSAMPPEDVVRFEGVQKVPIGRPPTAPIPIPRSKKKGPLNTPEIEGRAFLGRLLPAGESMNGFFYFQAWDVAGAKLYLTGIKDAATNQAYFYFDVPLDAK